MVYLPGLCKLPSRKTMRTRKKNRSRKPRAHPKTFTNFVLEEAPRRFAEGFMWPGIIITKDEPLGAKKEC